jgi:hypothetical protein
MGLSWERLRANYRHETLINRGGLRENRNRAVSNLSFTAIFSKRKPLISKEVRGFVVSGVWILLAAA